MVPMVPSYPLEDLRERLFDQVRPWQRLFQFWVRTVDIYTGYKVFQLRVNLVKDAKKQEELWERQHEHAAGKIYSMCSDLGGLFLKVAQLIGKPDLASAAWATRLVTLCDRAPATPFHKVQLMLEKELGRSFDDTFENLMWNHLVLHRLLRSELFSRFQSCVMRMIQLPFHQDCCTTAVHQGRLKGSKDDIAVKVQHPGIEDLIISDIHNLQTFALYLQKMDVQFDLVSVTKEMGTQIGNEFDFLREATAMEKIQLILQKNNKKVPVRVPNMIRNTTTRRVLVMEFIDGIPILNIGNEMEKRGINPGVKAAAVAKQNILKSLTSAYGQMILKSGFFNADPHPGNILICKGSEVALLDYGQVKDLQDDLRLGYASLIFAMADNDPVAVCQCYRDLGIEFSIACTDEHKELLSLAEGMFDTKLPAEINVLQPFCEECLINKISVRDLSSVFRSVQLLRGLIVGMGVNYSCAEQWRPIAEEALLVAGRLNGKDVGRCCGILRRIIGW